jgi:hypothetical protein
MREQNTLVLHPLLNGAVSSLLGCIFFLQFLQRQRNSPAALNSIFNKRLISSAAGEKFRLINFNLTLHGI